MKDNLSESIFLLAREVHELHKTIRDDRNNAILCRIEELEQNIMITQKELADGLKAVATQQVKIAAEQAARADTLLAKIAELQALIDAGGTITPEVEAAFTEVKNASQALDDVIPDAPTPA